MKKIKFDKIIIEEKIKLVEKHLGRLEELRGLSFKQLALPNNFDVAAWNLRCALEATFGICAHILARIPGAKIDEYKQMAIEMGRQKIIPMDFAENNLREMGGYRNRLTHFYFEVKSEEMHKIIQEDLEDFRHFLKHIGKILK